MEIYDSRHTGQKVDDAVDALQTTIPSQLTQIGSKLGDLANLQTTEKSNLVGAINEINDTISGKTIEQPSIKYYGYYGSDGSYTQHATLGYVYVNVSRFRGEQITCPSVQVVQYAFFKNFVAGQIATYADGTTRLSGRPTDDVIPSDADVLYLYIGNETLLPSVTVTGETGGMQSDISEIEERVSEVEATTEEINQQIGEILPYTNIVKNLGWGYSFNGTSSVATLYTPIVLEQDGDSIEFNDLTIGATSLQGGYGFSQGGHSSGVGIGLWDMTNYRQVNVRSDSGTFLFQFQPADDVKNIKISYEGGNIILYINGTASATYSGQQKLSLYAFGHGSSSYGYWEGYIGSVSVNGETYNLFANASFTDINLTNEYGFLTHEQGVLLYSKVDELYAEKSSTNMTVYKKLANGYFVGFPLVKRFKAYSEGAYPSYFDNWGIVKVGLYQYTSNGMVLVSELFQEGEAELAINVTSGTSSSFVYVGGSVHGFENIVTEDGERCITFLVNNIRIEEADSFELQPVQSIDVIQKTELCQAYTNSNSFAIATKRWRVDKDNMRITTNVSFSREVDIHQMQMGMFCVYRRWEGDTSKRYLTNRAIKNSLPYKVFNVEDGWSGTLNNVDHDCTKITEYGDMGYGFSMEITDANTKTSGGMFVHNNGTGRYNKMYYANCCDYTPSAGEQFYATQNWSIEA